MPALKAAEAHGAQHAAGLRCLYLDHAIFLDLGSAVARPGEQPPTLLAG
ncbi:hypothetical protein [Mesorhizobium sp. B4-1-3]|nr:hypothetical protein [Mesorhizobium sp. B4-1-3]